jgi:hypothetical protein
MSHQLQNNLNSRENSACGSSPVWVRFGVRGVKAWNGMGVLGMSWCVRWCVVEEVALCCAVLEWSGVELD